MLVSFLSLFCCVACRPDVYIFTWRLTPNCDESNEETKLHTNAPVVQWRQSTKRVSDVSLPISLHLPHLSAIVSIIRSHFPLCLIFSFSSASFAPFYDTFAAFPREWTQPRPSGPGVPDGLAGGRIATDPSAASLLPPQTPGGLRRYRLFRQDER